MTILVVNGQTNQTNVKRSFYNTATGINRSGFHRFDSVAYLLWDIFSTSRAAGGVNGIAAEPGPGVRTVVDTENKLSIAGGVLTFAGGKASPVWGDPGYWLSVQARVAGKVLLATMAENSTCMFGFGATQSGHMGTDSRIFLGNTNLYGPNDIIIAHKVSAASYQYAIVLRMSGFFAFIRGDAFVAWTLLWISALPNTAVVYPGITNWTSVITADNIRVPAVLWLPPPLAYDTFTRSDGALGTSEATGPDGQAASVRTWTGATWTVSSNKAVNTPTLGAEQASGNLVVGTWYLITATQANYFYTGCAINHTFRATATTALDANNKVKVLTLAELPSSCGDLGTPDVLASADLVLTAGTQAGLVTNLDSAASPANFLIAYHNGTNALLDKCVGSTYTNLISVAATYAASATLRLITYTSGGNLLARLYYNSVLIGSEQTISDVGIKSNRIHGLFSTYSANQLDHFTVFPRGSEGQFAVLDTM